jgi:hypothetical protein
MFKNKKIYISTAIIHEKKREKEKTEIKAKKSYYLK